MVERYTIGRKYNERQLVDVSLENLTPEGIQAIEQGLEAAAAAATIDGRIAPAVAWATKILQERNLPEDHNALMYSNAQWQRKNARSAPEWYAIRILQAAHFLRLFAQRNDCEMAAQYALDLAELVTEAKFILGVVVRNASHGGKATKLSDKRQEQQLQHAEVRQKAVAIWSKRPSYSCRRVAKAIDPMRIEAIRKIIADLKPHS
jgi:hypothetical protein